MCLVSLRDRRQTAGFWLLLGEIVSHQESEAEVCDMVAISTWVALTAVSRTDSVTDNERK